MERLRLTIDGMSCGHCVASVQRALAGVDGVRPEAVRVGEADVAYDASRADPATILAAVEDAGYTAHVATRAA
jgi:copper chaperone CopZ